MLAQITVMLVFRRQFDVILIPRSNELYLTASRYHRLVYRISLLWDNCHGYGTRDYLTRTPTQAGSTEIGIMDDQ